MRVMLKAPCSPCCHRHSCFSNRLVIPCRGVEQLLTYSNTTASLIRERWEGGNGSLIMVSTCSWSQIVSGLTVSQPLSTLPILTPLIGGGAGHGISLSTLLVADAVAIIDHTKLAKTLVTLFSNHGLFTSLINACDSQLRASLRHVFFYQNILCLETNLWVGQLIVISFDWWIIAGDKNNRHFWCKYRMTSR